MQKVVEIKGINEKKVKKNPPKGELHHRCANQRNNNTHILFFFFFFNKQASKQNPALIVASAFDFCMFPRFSTTFFLVNTSALTVALKY